MSRGSSFGAAGEWQLEMQLGSWVVLCEAFGEHQLRIGRTSTFEVFVSFLAWLGDPWLRSFGACKVSIASE